MKIHRKHKQINFKAMGYAHYRCAFCTAYEDEGWKGRRLTRYENVSICNDCMGQIVEYFRDRNTVREFCYEHEDEWLLKDVKRCLKCERYTCRYACDPCYIKMYDKSADCPRCDYAKVLCEECLDETCPQ